MKKIEISNPSFEEIRTNNLLYVDKTEYMYSLVTDVNSYYFIARPHNYGKSLMCSTLKCVFEGKRDIFKGLYIDSTDYSFEKYPVLCFNFAEFRTDDYEVFKEDFQKAIIREAKKNGIMLERKAPSSMMSSFLRQIDKKAVIIVDNHDSPISRTYKDTELREKIRDSLTFFYSVIKNKCEKIRFFFFTGVTKYTNMSIFSGFNNYTDISFDDDYASAFGYTEEELESNFSQYIDEYMKRGDREYETRNDFLSALSDYYGGYRFSDDSSTKVYNPVSVEKFFKSGCVFKSYAEETRASTLAVALAGGYQPEYTITDELIIGTDTIRAFDYSNLASSPDSSLVLALMYFTGYLTIKEGGTWALRLTFPNKEVRNAFTHSFMKKNKNEKVLEYFLKEQEE